MMSIYFGSAPLMLISFGGRKTKQKNKSIVMFVNEQSVYSCRTFLACHATASKDLPFYFFRRYFVPWRRSYFTDTKRMSYSSSSFFEKPLRRTSAIWDEQVKIAGETASLKSNNLTGITLLAHDCFVLDSSLILFSVIIK